MTDRDKALGPSPEDLIERLDRQAVNLATGYGRQLTTDLLSEASLALSQAQGRIGELEAIVRAVDPDWFSRGEPCGYPTCGCDADGACHIAIAQMEGETRGSLSAEARAQAAEGLLKEAGEVVRRIASDHIKDTQLPQGHLFHADCDACHRQELARDLLSKLSPGEGGGSDVIPEPASLGPQEAIGKAEPSGAEREPLAGLIAALQIIARGTISVHDEAEGCGVEVSMDADECGEVAQTALRDSGIAS